MNKNRLKLYIIAQIVAKQGFSINIHGKSPVKGYVSGFKCGEFIQHQDEIVANTIDEWVEENFLTIAEDKNLYAGGWLHEGEYYLELSRNIGDLTAARDFATKHGQLAIWDVEQNCEIILNYNL